MERLTPEGEYSVIVINNLASKERFFEASDQINHEKHFIKYKWMNYKVCRLSVMKLGLAAYHLYSCLTCTAFLNYMLGQFTTCRTTCFSEYCFCMQTMC